jgi:DNA-directed RNA polymerase specialized sigma24 family protein
MADAEDVAASVLHSLLKGARAGRFSRMANRNDLWVLLLAITRQKTVNLRRYHGAKKRGAGVSPLELMDVAADDPAPEFATMFEDLVCRLFERLPSDDFRSLARLRLEGWTNLEIADELGVTIRTVERKLGLIRDLWERWFKDEC